MSAPPLFRLVDERQVSVVRDAAAVRRVLDGPAPVLATAALKGSGFIAEVKARPDVRLVAVDAVNRDDLPAQLASVLRGKGGLEPWTMGEER